MTVDAWSPIHIGDHLLKHRIVLPPLTRNRASPSRQHDRTYVPNDLMLQYYQERTTDGGLLISEAIPVSKRGSGMPGVSGLFNQEQVQGWKQVVEAVHAKGGVFFAQLWHQGRNTHSCLTGQQPESSSDIPITSYPFSWSGYESAPFEVPLAMSEKDIQITQHDFVLCAKNALEAGFDGIELHAANGYLCDQFHHSNINKRTDAYGGTMEKRCAFTLELVQKLCSAIGPKRVGVRLAAYGLFNQTLGEDRLEQWLYLCRELEKLNLAYAHLIEPRFDELKTEAEKRAELKAGSVEEEITSAPFRAALGATPVIAAGGFGPENLQEGIRSGAHDMVALGRYFTSNPDLVQRLREGKALYKWNRSRFYGPFEDNHVGYTVHLKQEFANASDRCKPQLAE